jgi:molybdopterin synthase sulfur carrier subunit
MISIQPNMILAPCSKQLLHNFLQDPVNLDKLCREITHNQGLMTKSAITVNVKLFAAYQEACGVSELVLELPNGTTVAAVCDRLIAEHPKLAQWRDITRFGINLIFVEPDTLLQDGDEVVLIPPVSGG